MFEKSVSKYSKKLGINIPEINIKSQKARWGSVTKSGKINLNQKLIRAPQKIIDYVAAHEICHIKIPNHSPAYWELLESITSDYRERKEWLRINKSILLE
ncbi:MAG: M48 family metallopeptidase [Nitrosopumilus sp.]|nr:M48 family metallopeptidase [Nitrosopumilus sp.]